MSKNKFFFKHFDLPSAVALYKLVKEKNWTLLKMFCEILDGKVGLGWKIPAFFKCVEHGLEILDGN